MVSQTSGEVMGGDVCVCVCGRVLGESERGKEDVYVGDDSGEGRRVNGGKGICVLGWGRV